MLPATQGSSGGIFPTKGFLLLTIDTERDDCVSVANARDLVQLFGNEASWAVRVRKTKFHEKIVLSGCRIDFARLVDVIIKMVRDCERRAKFAFDLDEKRLHVEIVISAKN